VRREHIRKGKGWEVFKTKHLDLDPYKNERGFEQIADDLEIAYPEKA
jgi:hypothetical protein